MDRRELIRIGAESIPNADQGRTHYSPIEMSVEYRYASILEMIRIAIARFGIDNDAA